MATIAIFKKTLTPELSQALSLFTGKEYVNREPGNYRSTKGVYLTPRQLFSKIEELARTPATQEELAGAVCLLMYRLQTNRAAAKAIFNIFRQGDVVLGIPNPARIFRHEYKQARVMLAALHIWALRASMGDLDHHSHDCLTTAIGPMLVKVESVEEFAKRIAPRAPASSQNWFHHFQQMPSAH